MLPEISDTTAQPRLTSPFYVVERIDNFPSYEPALLYTFWSGIFSAQIPTSSTAFAHHQPSKPILNVCLLSLSVCHMRKRCPLAAGQHQKYVRTVCYNHQYHRRFCRHIICKLLPLRCNTPAASFLDLSARQAAAATGH